MTVKFVRCVDADDAQPHLRKSSIYQVEEETTCQYKLVGVWGGASYWDKGRFQDVPMLHLKCVNPDAYGLLVAHKVYEGYLAPNGDYQLHPNVGHTWDRKRFVVVPVPTTTTSVVASDDPEEDRLRAILFSSSHKGICPCGGSYGVCPYHPKVE